MMMIPEPRDVKPCTVAGNGKINKGCQYIAGKREIEKRILGILYRKVFEVTKPKETIEDKDFNSACSFIRLDKKDSHDLRKALVELGVLERVSINGRKRGVRFVDPNKKKKVS